MAFTALVNAVVTDLITPLIAAIGGKPHFNELSFTINNSQFQYGAFFNAVISFLILAAVVYYLIVAPDGQDHRALPQGSGGDHAGLPGVPQHDPARRDAVHVLHHAGAPGNAAHPRFTPQQ